MPGAAERRIEVACLKEGELRETFAVEIFFNSGGHKTKHRFIRGKMRSKPLEAIEADPAACTLSPASMVRGLASIALDPPQSAVVRHGGVFALDALPIGDTEGPFALLDGDELIAVYERRGSVF